MSEKTASASSQPHEAGPAHARVPITRNLPTAQGIKLTALFVLALAVLAPICSWRLTPSSPLPQLPEDKLHHFEGERSPDAQLSAAMAYVVASLRATESERPDAIVADPYAQQLAGDLGKQMQLLGGFKWSPPDVMLPQAQELLALRTRYLDEALTRRDALVRQVVILGSGLDTRAYRLETLRGRLVVEIDANKDLQEHKRNVMAQANAQLMAKRYHTITADLANDNWEQMLVEKAGFDPTERTFWCMEGLLSYLSRDTIVEVLKTIDALSPRGSVFWADIGGHMVVDEALLGGHTLKYGEDDPLNGVLGLTKWALRVQADLGKPGEHFGRKWSPMTLGEHGNKPIPMSFVIGTKPSDEKKTALLL